MGEKDCFGAFSPWATVKPKLPDAIQDKEVRSTVAHVLDGNEDIISFFFSNSCSSSLRTVKPGEGAKKKEGNSIRNGLATSVLNVASRDATLEIHMQPIKKPGEESQLMVDCSVPWTPMTLPDSISQPLPKEDTTVHTDISVKQLVGRILPEGPPACCESDAMESASQVQCDSVVPKWKNIVKPQGNNREQCPSPSKTETRGAERGGMGHLTTDELLLSVQLPIVNMSCSPAGDFTGDTAIEKPSQHGVEAQKEPSASQAAESLAEDLLKSCSPALPVQKPSRKFVYSLLTPSPSSHTVQSSRIYQQSDRKLPTLSGKFAFLLLIRSITLLVIFNSSWSSYFFFSLFQKVQQFSGSLIVLYHAVMEKDVLVSRTCWILKTVCLKNMTVQQQKILCLKFHARIMITRHVLLLQRSLRRMSPLAKTASARPSSKQLPRMAAWTHLALPLRDRWTDIYRKNQMNQSHTEQLS